MNIEFLKSAGQYIVVESLTDKVYGLLEAGILNMQFKPGDTLNEEEIAAALKVSRSPVREALLRLEHVGLVDKHKKYRTVAAITEETVVNNYHMWSMTEAYALRHACVNASQADLAAIEEMFLKMENYKKKENVSFYRELNYQFHSLMVAPCPYPNIVECHKNALNHIKWGYNFTLLDLENMNFSKAQHRHIFEAYVKKEKDVLERIIIEHVGDACDRMLSYLKNRRL